MDDAACAGRGDAEFFPISYETGKQAALRICGTEGVGGACPVLLRCRIYAWRNGIRDGIWGGMTPVERYRWAVAREKARIAEYHQTSVDLLGRESISA
jgi:hypothetical protein